MFSSPRRTAETQTALRPSSPRRRSLRLGLFDRLETRTLLSTTDPGWALRAGGPQNDSGKAVAVDGAGNVYEAGYFSGSADFNGDGVADLTSAGDTDGFLVKYSPGGAFLWATRVGSASTSSTTSPTELASAVAVAPDGSVYLAGSFCGTAQFGGPGLTLTSQGNKDAFVARLDPATGQFLWARRMGSPYDDIIRNMVISTDGIFVTGNFDFNGNGSSTGPADFGPFTLTSAGYSDIFVARLDTSGNFTWATRMGGASSDDGYGLALDTTGNLYVTGQFSGTADFGKFILTSNGNSNIFLARMNSVYGSVTWVESMGSSSSYGNSGRDVVADAAGNVYITGYFSATTQFGPFTLSATGSDPRGAYVAEVAPNGTFLWARQVGSSTAFGIGARIAFEPSGTLLVDGLFDSNPNHLARLDTSGNILWTRPLYSKAGAGGAQGMAVGPDGLVALTGAFWGTTAFDTGGSTVTLTADPASNTGNTDIFLLKYNPNLARISGTVYGDLDANGVRGAEPGLKNRTVYVDQNGNGVLDPGEPSTATDLDGNYSLGGLAAGTYTVAVITPAGWTSTNPATGSQSVTVATGQTTSTLFGSWTANTTLTRSVSPNLSIPDPGTLSSTLNVTDARTILDLGVTLSITHPSDGQLSVTLVAPDGTQVPLFAGLGGSGQNFTNTVLDSEAATPIASGAAPFTGTFRPSGDLAAFYGKTTQGTWTLKVTDGTKGYRGTLNNWSLNFVVPTAAPLRAATVAPTPVRQSLTPAQARPALAEALAYWHARGEDTSRLGHVDLAIADLGGDRLGEASGSTITLDDDAAGWGWSASRARRVRPGRMDLLSALTHEVGHLLGHDHSEGGVMAESLAPGVRQVVIDPGTLQAPSRSAIEAFRTHGRRPRATIRP